MKRIATLLLASLALAACDVPSTEIIDGAVEVQTAKKGSAELPCSAELLDIAKAKTDVLVCHAECATLMIECLNEPSPACFECEHEAAICRSTCDDNGLLWGAI